jgi:predicted secreted protein
MMRRSGLLFCILALAAAAGCGGDSNPTTPSEVSKFVGLWHMSLKGNPSDPGFDWRFNADNTVVLYNTGSTTPKGGGTANILGQTATGDWRVDSVNKGRFTSTLTGDNSLDFDFIEDKYTPAKTFYYAGSRLEGPPAGSTPSPAPGAGVDETPFKATEVIWECPVGNVGAWPITAKVTAASLTKDTLTIVRDPANSWPVRQSGKPDVGNFWIIGLCSDGKWHGGTVDWIGVGRTSTGAPNFDGGDGMSTGGSPQLIDAWRPRSGEIAYVMESTHARDGNVLPNNSQRTNIVKIVIP